MSYVPPNNNGQATMANSQPVVISSDQSAIPTTISSSALPTGASTSALQTTGNASLVSIDAKLTSPLAVTGTFFQATQPVSAVALPLPTGASTSANQVTEIASLASIDTKLTSPLSVDQSGTWNINNVSGTISLPTGAATSALQTTGNTSLSSIAGTVNTDGVAAGATGIIIGAKDGGGLFQQLLVDATGALQVAGITGVTSSNITQFGGTNISTGTGASGLGIPRVTVANDSNILATQSGTWTVQPGNTANTTAWLVTGTGGTFPATQSGTWTVQPGATANSIANSWRVQVTDLTNTMPTMDAIARKGFVALTDGTNTATVKAASTAPVATDTAVVVGLSPNVPVTAGSFAKAEDAAHTTGDTGVFSLGVRQDVNTTVTSTAGDYSAITVDQFGNTKVVGDIGSGVADTTTSFPVKIGGVAQVGSGQANFPTAVTATQRTNLNSDKYGRPVVQAFATRENINFATLSATNVSAETTIVTGVASEFHDVYNITVTCAANALITFRYGTAGTIFATIFTANNTPSSGLSYTIPIPMPTAAQNITIQSSSAVVVTAVCAYVVNK